MTQHITTQTIPEAIKALQNGQMVIVIDRADRENQGDIILAAETITHEQANFIIKECRGLFCIPMSQQRAVELDLPLMVSDIENLESFGCKFTVTVDAASVTAHGISASDRLKTVQMIANDNTKPSDLLRPGHAFPLIAQDGGVLERDGHTEATIDLLRYAGKKPIGVLSEILDDDGEPAMGKSLMDFAERFSLPIVSIDDLVAYRKKHPLDIKRSASVLRTATTMLPTAFGTFQMYVYKTIRDNKEHVMLTFGSLQNGPVLTRVHSQCLTGDTLHSQKCDCHAQLQVSLQKIKEHGSGVLIYLNQEGRGIGLTNKIRAYALQEKGMDTVEANEALRLPIDARDFSIATEMLKDQHIASIMLLSNNPDKMKQLEDAGVAIADVIPVAVVPNTFNRTYLEVKKKKLGHKLTL